MKIKIYDVIVDMALKSTYAEKNPEVLGWITKDLRAMIEYYKHVYSMEQEIRKLQVKYGAMDASDRQAYQFEVMELDRERTEKHNAAISALIDLDSCTRQTGYGSCVNVPDLTACHRTDIAEAIYDFCYAWVKSHNKTNK